MNRYDFEPKWFIVLIFTLAGIFVGGLSLFLWLFNSQGLLNIQKIHPGNSTYKFINPLLAVDTTAKNEFLESPLFSSQLEGIITKSQKSNEIKNAAVYFRDLESGHWAGINEDTNFSPGVLLKIPLMMAYLQQEAENPGSLTQKLVYESDNTSSVSNSLYIGRSYSIEELIDAMLIANDDMAANVLYDHVDKNALHALYSDLGVYFPEDKIHDDFLSIKQFALFFRVLYNATYLNREMSEKALDILSRASLSDGLVLTLPKDLRISHRYHTRTYKEKDQTLIESHSCGIIYYPSHPYLLCVVGVSDNNQKINNLFNQISELVYRSFTNKYKK